MSYKRENRLKVRKGKLIQWLVFTALLAYLIITLVSQQSIIKSEKDQYNQAVIKLEEAKEENIALQKDFASIGSDAFYEKVAREVFGYVLPEEKVFYESKN